MKKRVFLSPPHMSGKEQEYIAKAFESNYIAPLGPFVNAFEESICNYTSMPYALATINATSATKDIDASGIALNDSKLTLNGTTDANK
jgi:UDP-N-acetylbacillosamine transaminase